jgi:hypothetical protein
MSSPSPLLDPNDVTAPSGSPPAPGPVDRITLNVREGDKSTSFVIRSTVALGKLMAAYCGREGLAKDSRRFIFEGQRIIETDTATAVGYDGAGGLAVVCDWRSWDIR